MDDLCIDLNQKNRCRPRFRGERDKLEQDGEGCDAVLAGLTGALFFASQPLPKNRLVDTPGA
jgi:hypothetical protein